MLAATHRTHGADLIQGQLQQALVAALGHQLERRLLQAGGPVLEQQVRDVANALQRREGGGGAKKGRRGQSDRDEEEVSRKKNKCKERVKVNGCANTAPNISLNKRTDGLMSRGETSRRRRRRRVFHSSGFKLKSLRTERCPPLPLALPHAQAHTRPPHPTSPPPPLTPLLDDRQQRDTGAYSH